MRRALLSSVLFFILVFIFSPLVVVRAQTALPTSADVTLSVSPTVPSPNQSVNARVDSSSVDLTQATITWTVNGKSAAKGRDIDSITFLMGNIGSQTTVSVTVNGVEGDFTRSVTLSAGSVDLLYQGSGYVPPFYEGKELWGRENQITLLAIPHVYDGNGHARAASGLIYRWSKDGSVLGSNSGVGKNSISFTDTVLGLPIDVKVDIMSDASTILATAEQTFGATDPSVLVYESNPTYGYMFEDEVGNGTTIKDQEITLAAFPFLFSSATKDNPNIAYSWLTTGATTAEVGENVTYRATSGQAGSSNVTVTADASKFISQSAKKTFLVQFGSQQPSL